MSAKRRPSMPAAARRDAAAPADHHVDRPVRGATCGAGADFFGAGGAGASGAAGAGPPVIVTVKVVVMAAEAARNDRRFRRCMV